MFLVSSSLSSCGDDEPENPYGENNETPTQNTPDGMPQVEFGTSDPSSSIIIDFTVRSESSPAVYMRYTETETEVDNPSLNQKKVLEASSESYDETTACYCYTFKVSKSDFTKGNYLYYQIIVENDKGSCNSDIKCITLKNLDPEKTDDEKSAEMIIGKWQLIPSKDSDKLTFYIFNADGTGYYEKYESYDGIQRDWISKWEIINGAVVYKWAGSGSTVERKILISNDELVMNADSKYSKTYRRINNNPSSGLDYKETPYECYLCYSGVYYPLDVVVKKCEHGSGMEMNLKYIWFRGVDDEIWYQIRYFTPYYEGIDNYWPDGTYKVNVPTSATTSCWQYLGFLYIHNFYSSNWIEDTNGTLKISHSGKYYKYTYKSVDVKIYFEGIEQ